MTLYDDEKACACTNCCDGECGTFAEDELTEDGICSGCVEDGCNL